MAVRLTKSEIQIVADILLDKILGKGRRDVMAVWQQAANDVPLLVREKLRVTNRSNVKAVDLQAAFVGSADNKLIADLDKAFFDPFEALKQKYGDKVAKQAVAMVIGHYRDGLFSLTDREPSRRPSSARTYLKSKLQDLPEALFPIVQPLVGYEMTVLTEDILPCYYSKEEALTIGALSNNSGGLIQATPLKAAAISFSGLGVGVVVAEETDRGAQAKNPNPLRGSTPPRKDR